MKNKLNRAKNTYIDPKDFIDSYIVEVRRSLTLIDKVKVAQAIEILLDAYKKNKKIFIIGNGGSASTASHMACDLSKGTLQRLYDSLEKRFRVISLTDNVALITALANDLSYEDIFIQQLRSLVDPGDVIIAYSGSGNSKNIVKAIEYAKSFGAITIGILGFKTGGVAGKIVDCAILIDSNHYGPIEDIQLVISHAIAAWMAKVKKVQDNTVNFKSENNAVPFS